MTRDRPLPSLAAVLVTLAIIYGFELAFRWWAGSFDPRVIDWTGELTRLLRTGLIAYAVLLAHWYFDRKRYR